MESSFIETFDAWTLVTWLCFIPVYAVVEAAILILRGKKVTVATISQVARDRGWQLTSVVYCWGGWPTHWWANHESWAPVWSSVLFWVIPVGCLVADIRDWNHPKTIEVLPDLSIKLHPWHPWYRRPILWWAIGGLCGWILFPQAAG